MCGMISSVLLTSYLIVIGLSSPLPDRLEYKIPDVGNGDRSQYYVLHSDGTFKYGFDTGDGAFESAMSKRLGEVQGKFGYVDPDGRSIHLEYEAGKGGFVARGDHLPKPSERLAQAITAVVRQSQNFVATRSGSDFTDPLADSDADRSYQFRFDSEDHKRDEKSDSDGLITGSYSYTDENGVLRSFTYRAGKGIGFVIEGDGLTQDMSRGTSRPVQRPRTSTALHRASPSLRTSPQPFSYSGPEADFVITRSETPGDPSYSFFYDAGSHSRSEQSDSDLNIDGSFSFVADDGNRRTLTYVAGSDTGFTAEGDHLPVAPTPVEFGSRVPHSGTKFRTGSSQTRLSGSGRRTGHANNGQDRKTASSRPKLESRFRGTQPSTRRPITQLYQTPDRAQAGLRPATVTRAKPSVFRSSISGSRASTYRTSGASFGASKPQTTSHRSTSFGLIQTPRASDRSYEEADIRSSHNTDGSYSFSYDAASQARSEVGDSDLNIDGVFKFKSEDDGLERQITYEAGRDTGFIAEGVHLPIGPPVPGAPSGQPTGRLTENTVPDFIDPLANGDTDASYKFSFDSDTYSRSETADEDGNVSGTYTVVEEDGTRITYAFRAGRGIGYETKEVSRTKGPPPPKPVPYSGPLASPAPQADSTFRHSQVGQTRTAGFGSTGLRGVTKPRKPVAKPRKTSFATSRQSGYSYSPPRTNFKHKPSTRTSLKPKPSTRTSLKPKPSTRTRHHSKPASTRTNVFRSSLKPSHSENVFPGFTLHRYDASPNAEKFGYVLKFDQ